MKFVVWALAVVAVLAFAVPMLTAVEEPKDGMVATETPKTPPPNHHWSMVNYIDKVVGGLTEEQKAKITELDKTRQTAVREAMDKFHEGVLPILTPEQKVKYEKDRAEWKARIEKMRAAVEKPAPAPKTETPPETK